MHIRLAVAAAVTAALTGCAAGTVSGPAAAPVTTSSTVGRTFTLAEGTVIAGRYPITRLMDPEEAEQLSVGTPICFWSRAEQVAGCGAFRSADADGVVVDRPAGKLAPAVHDLVILVNDRRNAAVLGHVHRVDGDGFTVQYLATELAAMGADVALEVAPESQWNR